MNTSTVAGYKDLFPKGNKSYNHFVKDIPSEIIISFFIAINNELDSNEEAFGIQQRVYNAFTRRFSKKQNHELINSFNRFYLKTNRRYEGLMFGRRYLLELIAKELANYRKCPEYEDKIIDEYNLFKAYLVVVDEINARDHTFINFNGLDKTDPLFKYNLLWLPTLNQWEWNEKANIIFERFKLLCFLKYAKKNYYIYLKEYLEALNFDSIGKLLSSFDQVSKMSFVEDNDAMLKKLVYLKTSPNVESSHLEQQSINQLIGKENISISDIRKFPLFFKEGRGFMVIDHSTYHKKTYRGPFFELRTNTSLIEKEDFNSYSKNVSDELEKKCLQPIIDILVGAIADVKHFDDETISVSDAYIRIGNKIFLFEYKAYFFPEKLTNLPNFDDIKSHIDKKFVKNEKRKNKGINQLKAQIEIINGTGFHFDLGVKEKLLDIVIYPILIHQDFQFSLPGITDYLNNLFREAIMDSHFEFSVKSLIIVDLEVLLDIATSGKDILYFESLIKIYDKYIEVNKGKLQTKASQENFLNAHVSFDQLYNTKLIKRSEDPSHTKNILKDLLRFADISLDEFNKPLI